jgi:hypothetical protein
MADILHRRDAPGARSPSSPGEQALSHVDRRNAPPRTDVGTIVLHWLTAITFLVSLFTGVRIAADALHAPVSHFLTPILPQGEIWTWHFVAGLALFFCGSAYLLYMRRSGLSRRAAPKKLRVFFLPVVNRLRFGALNVALHWALYILVVLLTSTGIILYLGYGGWWVYIHSTAAFVGMSYIFVHVASHYLYGGWQQLFRVFRPAALVATKAMRPRPLLIGSLGGVAVAVALVGIDWSSRDTLVIHHVNSIPKLDGVMDDAIWTRARPVVIHTQQGANFGGSGESTVEVRAVHNGTDVFFAFKWTDPTRSLRRIPIIKKEDGWHALDNRADRMDVVDFYEDKLAIIFSDTADLGGAGVTHLGSHPLPADKPRPFNERGFHYTTDGSTKDLWQWKASRGGMLGRVDDQFMGPPYEPSAAEASYNARYQGGYWNDPGRAYYSYNYKFFKKGYHGPVEVLRLPKDLKKTVANLGKYDLDPDSSDDENGRWYLFDTETDPYTKEADARIPVGTVLPGVIISGKYEGDRADLVGASKWKDGYWTLEVTRRLKTGSKYDKDFNPEDSLYMWVSVFDHTQTRHSRHPRPVRVVTQE